MKQYLIAEWIETEQAYRLYDPKHPRQTVAYEDTLAEARAGAARNGYALIERKGGRQNADPDD